MTFCELIKGLASLLFLGLFIYYEGIHPYLPRTLFSNLKREFEAVAKGQKGYEQFVTSFVAKYLQPKAKDTEETVILKNELYTILYYEKFIRKSLSNPKITLYQFKYQWDHYDVKNDEEEIQDEAHEINVMEREFELKDARSQVNIDVLYKYLEDRVWADYKNSSHPTKEELEKAIYNADFSQFMADSEIVKFKDYPLIIICNLKCHFQFDWYKKACSNIKKEPTQVSGWHKDNVKASSFNRDFPANIIVPHDLPH